VRERPGDAIDCPMVRDSVGAAPGWAREAACARMRTNYADVPDGDLLERASAGERGAFDEIVKRRGPFALRVAMRLTRNPAIAEDLVQEAMMRAWHRAARFDSRRGRFTTWLYRILVNLCLDERRRQRPEPLSEDLDPPDPAGAADEPLAAEQRDLALVRTLEQLPPRQRAAITLVYDEGMSGAEVARVLGASTKAVERLLARARDSIRKQLRKDEPC
jgi:RNA polymerase sigma-70 factor, ECF subfamily